MYEDLKKSESLWDDLDILQELREGDLVISVATGRVAEITKSTKNNVTAFGITFRRSTGDEAGRYGNGGRRILPLTTRTLEEVVYKRRPEERPTPQHNPAKLKAILTTLQTPAQRLTWLMAECAKYGDKFTMKVQNVYGNPTMYVVGYHIHGQEWVTLDKDILAGIDERIEFPDQAFHMACAATGCEMRDRPIKQPGLNYHWIITAGAQPDGLSYTTQRTYDDMRFWQNV